MLWMKIQNDQKSLTSKLGIYLPQHLETWEMIAPDHLGHNMSLASTLVAFDCLANLLSLVPSGPLKFWKSKGALCICNLSQSGPATTCLKWLARSVANINLRRSSIHALNCSVLRLSNILQFSSFNIQIACDKWWRSFTLPSELYNLASGLLISIWKELFVPLWSRSWQKHAINIDNACRSL